MRRDQLLLRVSFLLFALGPVRADEPAKPPRLIVQPDSFETLIHPHCSHCLVEANRRKQELRADDRVLSWIQVQTDGYINDGAIPIRFFLSGHRVLDDGWGQFVYDPDAGFARGFAPDAGPFRFHGWHNGVMVMKSKKDGTLYSCLTGVAFEGPRKGSRLEPRPTLVSDWGFWHKRYPQAVAYTMYDKYQPVELPTVLHEDSVMSRGPADPRLPADTPVLGVWDGRQARAYPLEVLQKEGVIHETANGQPRLVLWYAPTRTAVAYRQPFGTSGLAGDAGWVFSVDAENEEAPFVDKRTSLHWDITGRSVGGGPRLVWLDSVQVKWFAWAAEYPETSIYGGSSTQRDAKPVAPKSAESVRAGHGYKSLTAKELDIVGPMGNLNPTSRRFGTLKAADPQNQRVTLLIEGESEPKEWALSPGAELWHDGWWGRLDQFTVGDRAWVWFEKDRANQPVKVALLADELSEQDFYAAVKVKALNATGTDLGTATLETVQQGKPTVRTVKLANADVIRGSAKAPLDSLKVDEMIYVQSTGDNARLILDSEAFEKRRATQKAVLRKQWADEGLPGTLIFSHTERREVELMLDHEAMRWGRSLQAGDKVTLQAAKAIPAVVRQLRPWRERTQVLLAIDGSERPELTVGQRLKLRLAAPPADTDDDNRPVGLDRSRSKTERVELLISSVYCTCGMNDVCAGHTFTLAACDSGPGNTCALAKRTRQEVAEMIDKGKTDREILDDLVKERGPNLLRPHMSPRKVDGGHK